MLMRQTGHRLFMRRNVAHFATAAIGLFVCGWLTLSAAQTGISRLLSDYGLRANLQVAADRAVNFGPFDPESYYARASLLSDAGEYEKASRELEHAITLRPRDYMLWLELGLTRDQSGDGEGAIAAFREAARLSPYYAQPRWQIGNALLRAGRYDEAFAELRRAVASNPALLPNVIDLAYGLYGEAAAVERAVQPQTPSARMALARFFARNGAADDSIRLFRSTDQISAQGRQDLLTALLIAKKFSEAYEVWASGVEGGDRQDKTEGRSSIVDGGFEREIRVNSPPGFGWRIGRDQQAVRASLDTLKPHSGARSLLIEWNGDPQPSVPSLSQMILVEPEKRYRMNFWMRSQDLVTGQPPSVIVIASGGAERLLAQIALPSRAVNRW